MKTKEILIEIIELLSVYEDECTQSGSEINMTDFMGFMNSRLIPQNVKAESLRNDYSGSEVPARDGSDTDISILIVLLFRYAKGYLKKAFKDSCINTADEFSFLITLLTCDNLSKTELIQKQIMEKTSGTEIINRLLKLGLIEQWNDEMDKRSIRVKISDTGRLELFKILPNMRMVSQIVSGNLSETEKVMLAYLLRKLEMHHNAIYHTKKDYDLGMLMK